METEYCIVYCTFPTFSLAREAAKQLVKEKLAACVNIMHHVTSIFAWEEKVEEGIEALAIIKTATARFPELEAFLKAQHTYTVPEIIATPIVTGNQQYLDWIGIVVEND